MIEHPAKREGGGEKNEKEPFPVKTGEVLWKGAVSPQAQSTVA